MLNHPKPQDPKIYNTKLKPQTLDNPKPETPKPEAPNGGQGARTRGLVPLNH